LALFTGEGNKAAVDEFIAVALDSFDKAEFSDHALPTLLEKNKSVRQSAMRVRVPWYGRVCGWRSNPDPARLH
jgi:hypothetical protein